MTCRSRPHLDVAIHGVIRVWLQLEEAVVPVVTGEGPGKVQRGDEAEDGGGGRDRGPHGGGPAHAQDVNCPPQPGEAFQRLNTPAIPTKKWVPNHALLLTWKACTSCSAIRLPSGSPDGSWVCSDSWDCRAAVVCLKPRASTQAAAAGRADCTRAAVDSTCRCCFTWVAAGRLCLLMILLPVQ